MQSKNCRLSLGSNLDNKLKCNYTKSLNLFQKNVENYDKSTGERQLIIKEFDQ